MPNRIVREAINSSPRVDELSESAELFYRRLLNVVDDFGRFEARTGLLLTRTYPLRAHLMHGADVIGWLHECQATGLIVLYAKDGRHYLELQDFRQRVRATHSPHPAPKDPGCTMVQALTVPIETPAAAARGRHALPKKPPNDGHMTAIRPSGDGGDVDVDEGGKGCFTSKVGGIGHVGGGVGEGPQNPPPVDPPVDKPAARGAPPKRATRLPADWKLPREWGEWALEQDKSVSRDDVLRWAAKFKNWWIAKPGKDGTKLDWHATWRNWVLTELERKGARPAAPDPNDPVSQLSPVGQRTARNLQRWMQDASTEGGDDGHKGPGPILDVPNGGG